MFLNKFTKAVDHTIQSSSLAVWLLWTTRVSALWSWHNEPQFVNGADWPICTTTRECCPLIFPIWTANHLGRSHQGQEEPPVVSGSAEITHVAGVPRLIKFYCFDQVPTTDREAAGEPFAQGPFYILCPIMTEAQYRSGVERQLPDAEGFWVANAECINLDPTARTFSDTIAAGIAACRQLMSGGQQHQALIMGLGANSIVHPLTSNTGSDRSKFPDNSATAGFYLSITPLDFHEVTVKESQFEILYETQPNKIYRICAYVPPGRGHWKLETRFVS